MLGYEEIVSENKKDLSENISVQEAQQQLKDYFQIQEDEELNLIQSGIYQKQELQEWERQLIEIWGDSQDVITAWESNEYIALEYEIRKNGISVYGRQEPSQGMVGDFNVQFATYARALLGDGQLKTFEIINMYMTDKPEEVKIMSAEEALNILKGNFEDILTDEIYTIKEIKLEYVAIPDWSSGRAEGVMWTPYWCFIRSDRDGYFWADRINAITGGNLAYGE